MVSQRVASSTARVQVSRGAKWATRKPVTVQIAYRRLILWLAASVGLGQHCAKPAVGVVAAYLADQDADVYNITNGALRQDALTAALNLTALSAAAVTALAAATGHTPRDTLRSIEEAGFGEFSRQPGPAKQGSGVQAIDHDPIE